MPDGAGGLDTKVTLNEEEVRWLAARRAQFDVQPAASPPGLKIDLGCGPNKFKGPDGKETGWIGIDKIAFDGVDHVLDFGNVRWPFDDGSVSDVWSSHSLEHLSPVERIHVVNELQRVLRKDGKATFIVPHWSSGRAFGDPTHHPMPVVEWWFYYLDREWRAANAPHTDKKHWRQGFDCHLGVTWGYNVRGDWKSYAKERQDFGVNHYRDVAQDMQFVVTKK